MWTLQMFKQLFRYFNQLCTQHFFLKMSTHLLGAEFIWMRFDRAHNSFNGGSAKEQQTKTCLVSFFALVENFYHSFPPIWFTLHSQYKLIKKRKKKRSREISQWIALRVKMFKCWVHAMNCVSLIVFLLFIYDNRSMHFCDHLIII